MIYIDVTDTIKIPYITGIQRVVRNIINHSYNDELVSFVEFDRTLKKYILISKNDKRLTLFIKYKEGIYAKPLILYNFIKSTFSKKNKHLIIRFLFKIDTFKKNMFVTIGFRPKINLLDILRNGDTLLLADSTWNYHPWIEVKKAKNKGVKIKQVVYDILPILYPSYFEKITNYNFNLWFKMIQYYCDEIFAISQTTANNFAMKMDTNYLSENNIRLIRLGSDIEKINPDNSYMQEGDKTIKFLSVGTIEPRKNHKYLLKTFDELWKSRYKEVEWHIVGKEGWHSEDFMEVLRYHPLLDKKLFFHNNIDDKNLNELYVKSNCIIVPSIDEGYGLQIAEAIINNCYVLASNIEVFKEFNLSTNSYFSIEDNGKELRSKIIQVIDGELDLNQAKNVSVFTWKESIDSFLSDLRH